MTTVNLNDDVIYRPFNNMAPPARGRVVDIIGEHAIIDTGEWDGRTTRKVRIHTGLLEVTYQSPVVV